MTRAALNDAYPSCRDRNKAYCILGSIRRTGDRYTYVMLQGIGKRSRIQRTSVGRWDRRFECALGCG